MKLSTKGRYGLRALTDLVYHSNDSHIALKAIANRQSISESYLESIFSSLKKANILHSIKGSHGGYLLARPADNITVGEILSILEGDLTIVDPLDSCQFQQPDSFAPLLQSIVWDEITHQLNQFVDTLSLQDLVDRYADHSIIN